MSVLERLNVKVTGQGARALVFAHGYGCDQTVWRHVAPAFADEFQVVLYDLAGHGGAAPGSDDFERHASLDGHAEDLLAVCDALGLRQPVVVGHSISASTALRAALMRPGFAAALARVAPSPSFLNQGDYRGGFEREAIADLPAAPIFIRALRERGVRFALDDFGAGLSSFAYLQTLPVDLLKIDGGFVHGLHGKPVNRAIVESIHRVGKLCGLQTVAEWVEDEQTAECLRRIGVDHLQGYAVGRPQPLLGWRPA